MAHPRANAYSRPVHTLSIHYHDFANPKAEKLFGELIDSLLKVAPALMEFGAEDGEALKELQAFVEERMRDSDESEFLLENKLSVAKKFLCKSAEFAIEYQGILMKNEKGEVDVKQLERDLKLVKSADDLEVVDAKRDKKASEKDGREGSSEVET